MRNNFLNKFVKKTPWYESNYGDAVKMKNWNISNLDLATLGSSAVKYGLDYSNHEINAANWAMAPQDNYTSLAILKTYHSFIKENGIVLHLLLCPFQAMSNRGIPSRNNIEYWSKYHYFLSPVLIKHFSEQTLKRIRRIIDNPLLGLPKTSIKALVKELLGKDKPKYANAKTDAQSRITGWKKQFSIESFADPISEENLKAIEYNTEVLCEIAKFCKERSLRPVFGIMPATKTLKEHIPAEFMQRAFFDMAEKVKERTGVQFLDFYRSQEFESEDLYLDSFLLNEKGRKLFTERVLTELKCPATKP